jgi:gas vesicle protein
MSSSEQLERETEQTRTRLAATLDELRARMTPGQVVDQLVDYANDSSGGMFFRNLREQIVRNPLPVTLMGAGLAWLALANRRGTGGETRSVSTPVTRDLTGSARRGMHDMRDAASDWAGQAKETAGEWSKSAKQTAGEWSGSAKETVGEWSGSAKETAAEWSGNARQTAGDWSERAKATAAEWSDSAQEMGAEMQDAVSTSASSTAERASSMYGAAASRAGEAGARLRNAALSAADATVDKMAAGYDAAAEQVGLAREAVKNTSASVRNSLAGSGRNVINFLNEQPLVLAGIGITLGALLGLALPSTEAEDRLMGETSDAAKRQTTQLAREQMEKSKAVAEQAWQSAKEESQRQGFTQSPDGDSSAASGHETSSSEQATGEDTSLVPVAGDGMAGSEQTPQRS